MNLPNKLTLSRMGMAFIFLFALVADLPFSKNMALFVFVLAAITDWFDGVIARKYNLITNFGKLMDPLADKVLTAAALIAFIAIPVLNVPAWMVVMVITREFVVSGMRSLAASQGVILAATRSGKHKLASQVIFISLMLLLLSVREWGALYPQLWQESFDVYLGWLSWGLMGVVVCYAMVSGVDFFVKNAKMLFKEL